MSGKAPEPQPDPLKEDPRVVRDDTPFPDPDLYFKVYDSEKDEPYAKVRSDVNKLYERWQEKYGRRWPEDGLNTEDMVWLAEEAYKQPGSASNSASKSRKNLVPVEKEEFTDEFIKDDADTAATAGTDVSRAAGAGAAGPASTAGATGSSERRPRLSNYEKTQAGGKWITDEFESEEYEAGNLEAQWNMYLWDKDGKPQMMPEGPANEAEGEESEEWDDFHTAWRPRHVDSDEAREAVWATDEFESDEDNTEDEWQPEYLGAGLGLIAEDPINPQYSLRHSHHPLAPFPGEPLKWESYVYMDGTTFEGLTKQAIPHGMGVMTFGTGTGAGFSMRETRVADKYEGEFQAGYAHGLGQFTSESQGEVYIGEFYAGQRHGCGIKINMKPFYYLLERGEDPASAYRKTYRQIMQDMEFRTWYRGQALGDNFEDETVLYQVKEDFENPYHVVLKNKQHDVKLKTWQEMSQKDKVLSRMVDIIDNLKTERKPSPTTPKGESYFKNSKGMLVPVVTDDGNDTEYDSVDMIVGNETDGNMGIGWDGATDSSEFPIDLAAAEKMHADYVPDRQEYIATMRAVLGDDIVNPFNGLDMYTYLTGKEDKHKELFSRLQKSRRDQLVAQARRKGVDNVDFNSALEKVPVDLRDKYEEAYRQALRKELVLRDTYKDGEGSSYLEDEAAGGDAPHSLKLKELRKQLKQAESKLGNRNAKRVLDDMERYDRAAAEDEPLANPRRYTQDKMPLAADDTDTRFETESDMMEMCDLAEILGTVDEAREIVTRARMWRFKPYGEVANRYAQDSNGAPVALMQDPIHYPHNTKFMAPGPLGQCHPVPDDGSIRIEMAKVARNYARVHEMYNFDYDPEPGSTQYIIDQRIRRAQELQSSQLVHYLEAAELELGGVDGEALQLASTQGVPAADSASLSQRIALPRPAGSAFASMSMSMSFGIGHASRVIMDALAQLPGSRTRVLRPSAARRQR